MQKTGLFLSRGIAPVKFTLAARAGCVRIALSMRGQMEYTPAVSVIQRNLAMRNGVLSL
jgi:hypothetical protein